jgi:hypothetical protein
MLLVVATASPLPAVETTDGAARARTRLSKPAHDPSGVRLSPDGDWVIYRAIGSLYAVRVGDGKRHLITDLPGEMDIDFTHDGKGILILRPDYGNELLRAKLKSGSPETLGEPVSYWRNRSPTFDGTSVVFLSEDDTITWWDADGSVTPLAQVDYSVGLAAAPDRDLVLYAEYEAASEDIHIIGVTSAGSVTAYGTVDGLAGYTPGRSSGVQFVFLPDQDRVIVSLDLRDGRFTARASHILDLDTKRIVYAAPAYEPQVSPDGSLAFFEVDDSGKTYGRVVPTEHPGQGFNLPDKHARGWWVHPDWTYVAESSDLINVYEMDGSFVNGIDHTAGVLIGGAFVGDYFLTTQQSSDQPLYSDPITGSSTKRLSPAKASAHIIDGYAGYVYWVDSSNGTWAIWRSTPDGRNRARITPPYDNYDYWDEFSTSTGRLIYVADEAVWAIDLDALPRYACVDRVASFIGTNSRDVVNGTDGNDVIVTLGGDDVIRANAGRDRICSGDGADRIVGGGDGDWIRGGQGRDELMGGAGDDNINDRRGRNDTHGGPGVDLCKVTGITVGCEKP